MQDADDSRGPLVARTLQSEPLDQLGIGRAAGDRRGPRVRHVREQGSERDHHLDTELARQVDDHSGERAPAQVRLDSEQEHRVAFQAGDR